MSNLVVRILVSIVGIPCLLWPAWTGGGLLWVLVVLLQLAMMHEWSGLLSKRGFKFSWIRMLILLAGLYAVFLSGYHDSLKRIGIIISCIWLLSFLFSHSKSRLSDIGSSLLFAVYVVLPLMLWPRVAGMPFIPGKFVSGTLILLFVSTWFCDSGAYFVGRAIGKHKLFERISPKKTVEGAIGGLLFSALPLVLLNLLGWGESSIIHYLILIIAVGIFGQAGDLLESLFKREVGVKDSSQLIPGHGGFLDRFDSLLISTPVFFSFQFFVS